MVDLVSDRENIENRSIGVEMRNRINNNFKKMMDPNYQYAFGAGTNFTIHQTIPHKTWTTVAWTNVATATGNAYWNEDRTILILPFGLEGTDTF